MSRLVRGLVLVLTCVVAVSCAQQRRSVPLSEAAKKGLDTLDELLQTTDRQSQPARWTEIQILRGVMLVALGQRQSSPIILSRAGEALRSAIETAPTDTKGAGMKAMAQRMLGLLMLGTSGADRVKVTEAASFLRQSLSHYQRETKPKEWAVIQSHLGRAELILGKAENSRSRLESAVSLLRQSLEVITRDDKKRWVQANVDLAAALAKLGELKNDRVAYGESVFTYRAALSALDREIAPERWSDLQNNLGAVLKSLALLTEDRKHIQEAIDAFTASLSLRKRELGALQWAVVQANLGDAQRILGRLSDKLDDLVRARATLESALEVIGRVENGPLRAAVWNNLALTLSHLGEKKADPVMIRDAISLFGRAIDAVAGVREMRTFAQVIAANQARSRDALAKLARRI